MNENATNKFSSAKISPMLLRLVVIFVSFMLMSTILANHVLSIGGISLDAGNLTFPVTYVLSDVFSEVYGYKWSRKVTWYAATMNLIMSALIILAGELPSPEWYNPVHFRTALGASFRLVVSGILAYFIGDWVNDLVFARMKKKYSGLKGFAWRAILSSVLGSMVDSTIFVTLAFSFTMPWDEMIPMIGLNVAVKTLYEIVILPITTIVAKNVKKQEGQYQTYMSTVSKSNKSKQS